MTRTNKLTLGFAIAALMLTTAGNAMAEGKWAHNHPRRHQVNQRLDNQNARINREVREGEMTRGQARDLHTEDHAIRQEERTMAGEHHGHITRQEQRELNQQENVVSRQIGQ